MTKKAPTLDSFASSEAATPGPRSRVDRLPEELRSQLLSSSAGHASAVRWLLELGHDGISEQMVSHWRRRNGWVAA